MADIAAAAAAAAAAGSERLERKPSIEQAAPSAGKDSSTVTVSTDAWLALRSERNQREQQIRAMELQVAAATHEIDQLAEVRSQLRVYRERALEKRRQGNELHEVARMAAEEVRCLRVEFLARMQEEAAAKEAEEAARIAEEEAAAKERAAREEEAEAERKRLEEDDEARQAAAAKAEEAERRALEWKRLISERETTARELANMLQRTDELEITLEDRRIELQAAEKKREREKRSLLTALRELDWTQAHANGDQTEAEDDSEREEPPDTCPKTLTTAGYIQRMSELEDACERLQGKLDAVAKRESVFNENATVRGAALRYAATAAGRSIESLLANAGDMQSTRTCVPQVQVQSRSCTPMLPPNTVKKSADLEGLAFMLEDLFVENFALRSEVLGAISNKESGEDAGADEREPPKIGRSASDVDLSTFIKADGDASDDDELHRQDVCRVDDDMWALPTEAKAPPLTPRHSEYWPDPESPRSLLSPRLNLLAESHKAFQFDFTDMSVAES
jgi:DNA repair exonuclease SbcCD ATPase subunit